MAGHLDDVAELGERFRQDWVRAGRPVASNLASAAGAVAMVHGLRGDDIERRRWRSITEALRAGQGRRRTSDLAWSHTFDAPARPRRRRSRDRAGDHERRHRRRPAVAAVAPGHVATVVRRAVGRGGRAGSRRRSRRPRRQGSGGDDGTTRSRSAIVERAAAIDRWRPSDGSVHPQRRSICSAATTSDVERSRRRRLVGVMAHVAPPQPRARRWRRARRRRSRPPGARRAGGRARRPRRRSGRSPSVRQREVADRVADERVDAERDDDQRRVERARPPPAPARARRGTRRRRCRPAAARCSVAAAPAPGAGLVGVAR